MKIAPAKTPYVLAIAFSLLIVLSCSKDSDLLTDYISKDPSATNVLGRITVNDNFQAIIGQPTVMDVLQNDTVENPDSTVITTTSTPENGSVEINPDNTVTYTPETTTPAQDNFTYTVEETQPDGTVNTDTGSVTVDVKEPVVLDPLGELKAFPDAVGFGKYATGGRGGRIYEVTNLNSSGAGSLAYGLETLSGPRTIIFKVGGIINHSGSDYVYVKNGDVTIAGQTAPGDGILIRGELRIQSSNVIVSHVRVRPGSEVSGSNQACVRIAAYGGRTVDNIILDHVSMSWAKDENLTITEAGGETGSIRNVTVQNCFITDNITSGYNVVLFQKCYNISFYQNLLTFSGQRNIRSSDCGNTWEMINNYIYNYTAAAVGTYEDTIDVIGNNWETGSIKPEYTDNVFDLSASKNNCPDSDNSLSKVYYSDNLKDGSPGTYGSAAKSALQSKKILDSGLSAYPADLVKERVLSEAGAYHNLPQGLDSFDAGRISDVYADRGDRMTSAYYPADFPTISNGTPYVDTDKDGISDNWEIENGLNPNDSSDGQKDRNGDGYTNLEEFLYYLTIQ